jgi:internalin A
MRTNFLYGSKTGAGLSDLKEAIARQAADLPLMGQHWPSNWLSVEKLLLDHLEHHIDSGEYVACCQSCQVNPTIAHGSLGSYLHDLGKILYFRDDDVLSNFVVLKPNWVSKAISKVLDDTSTIFAKGVLSHADLPRIWDKDENDERYEPHLRPIFLRLMERFDLSYQIEADAPENHPNRSLVPQLLPFQPPLDATIWPANPPEGPTQVSMIYRLGFVPAGIISWFIVRTHRYSVNLHWRDGVVLEYEKHSSRVELSPLLREIRLVVWGSQPHNFFTILKNTMDLILSRFEGLSIQRDVPCICHWERGGSPCSRYYPYEDLVRRMEAKRHKVECPNSFAEISVPTLLYGIHTSTDEQVMQNIRQDQQAIRARLDELQKLDLILEKLSQQSELIARNFTRQWNLEMHKLNVECPNTFCIMTGNSNPFNVKNWVSQEYTMYLLCQHPARPHIVGEGYTIRKPEEWWATISPWLNHLIKFLKFAVPMGKVIGAVYDEVAFKQMESRIDLLEKISESLPMITNPDSMEGLERRSEIAKGHEVIGSALRALHHYLKEVDPSQIWGGLMKTMTPDGNILWLCDEHRQPFEAKPLVLDI